MKTVLLFSAGMDSYIINRVLKPDVLLFIDNRSRYINEERKFLERVKYENLIILENILNHSELERENANIPLRNLYFILLATNYGDKILLGSTLGDRAIDTQLEFLHKASEIATLGLLEDGRKIVVDAPFKGLTKSDYFRKLIELNRGDYERSIEEIYSNSLSCYHPEDMKPCGLCKPCLRKYLSILEVTSIDTSKYYINSPYEHFSVKENTKKFIETELKRYRDRESQENINLLIKMFL